MFWEIEYIFKMDESIRSVEIYGVWLHIHHSELVFRASAQDESTAVLPAGAAQLKGISISVEHR